MLFFQCEEVESGPLRQSHSLFVSEQETVSVHRYAWIVRPLKRMSGPCYMLWTSSGDQVAGRA